MVLKTYIRIPEEDLERILEALDKIINKEGPFKIDKNEFTWSVMENSTKIAKGLREYLLKAQRMVSNEGF